MTVNTKIYIGLGALAVAVFLGTVIMRAAPEDVKKSALDPQNPNDPKAVGELLRYDYSHIFYDPYNERVAFREHPGFYERNDYKVPLWFSNPNVVPIKMTFLNTSCGACSFAEIADVPTPKVDGTVDPTPFGSVFGGNAGIGLDYAEYVERKKLYEQIPADKWQRIVAQNSTAPVGDPKAVAEFPAGSPDKPRWGVIRLNIKVNETKTLTATVGLQKPNMTEPAPVEFKASVALAPMCDVYPPLIQLGELPESFTSVTETVYYFSSTRTVGGDPETELPKPIVGGLKNDPFLTATEPVPMTDAERVAVMERLQLMTKMPMRVSGGYKVKLTLSRVARDPANPDKTREIDIGPAERLVNIAPSSGTVEKVPQVTVKSTVMGVLTVEDGAIDLKSFQSREGIVKTVRVFTDRKDIELEAAPDQSNPQYLGVELSDPEKRNDRTYWTLKVKVAPNAGGGRLQPGSTVAVRVKGTGQLIRIPVSGNGQS